MKTLRGLFWNRVKAWMSSLAAGRTARGLSIAARLDMGSKKSLLVVEYERRRFLVGSGAETISAIVEIECGRPRGSREPLDREALRRRRKRARLPQLTGASRTGARRDSTGDIAGQEMTGAMGVSMFGSTVGSALYLFAPATKLIPGLDGRITGNNAVPWNIVFTLTLLTVLPALVLSMTPMVRLLIVFHFLRQALGTQTAPSNQTLIGLGLFITWFLMQPVLLAVDQQAVEPYRLGQITGIDAIQRGSDPPRLYMLKYAREKDLELFASAALAERPAKPSDLPLRVVVPAYMLSELKAGFQIGAVLFLPFLLVDLVVASITTSIGMFQLPPVVVSTPLKIMLFVMVDGWNLLAGSLLKSF